MNPSQQNRQQAVREQSFREVTENLSRDVNLLAQKEIELAKAELNEKLEQGKKIGISAGSGAILAHAGMLMLLFGVAFALSAAGMALWFAASLVGVVVFAAGMIALRNAQKKAERTDPMPREFQRNVRRDFRTMREAAR